MKTLFISIFLFSGFTCFAQVENSIVKNDTTKKIVYFAEEMPIFPGGEEAFNKFIGATYVCDSKGTVNVEFVIDSNGNLNQAKILKKLTPKCDAEALRIVYSIGKWTPGYASGIAVPVTMRIPIKF